MSDIRSVFFAVAVSIAPVAAMVSDETAVADLAPGDAVCVSNWSISGGALVAEEGKCRRAWFAADLPSEGLYAVDVSTDDIDITPPNEHRR